MVDVLSTFISNLVGASHFQYGLALMLQFLLRFSTNFREKSANRSEQGFLFNSANQVATAFELNHFELIFCNKLVVKFKYFRNHEMNTICLEMCYFSLLPHAEGAQ